MCYTWYVYFFHLSCHTFNALLPLTRQLAPSSGLKSQSISSFLHTRSWVCHISFSRMAIINYQNSVQSIWKCQEETCIFLPFLTRLLLKRICLFDFRRRLRTLHTSQPPGCSRRGPKFSRGSHTFFSRWHLSPAAIDVTLQPCVCRVNSSGKGLFKEKQ